MTSYTDQITRTATLLIRHDVMNGSASGSRWNGSPVASSLHQTDAGSVSATYLLVLYHLEQPWLQSQIEATVHGGTLLFIFVSGVFVPI